MKKYTQQDFDNFEIVDGYRQCPTGDYTDIKSFGESCSFGKWCSFGERCSFGEQCSFGESCSFEGLEFTTKNYFLRVSNIGSRGDGCYIFNAKSGIYIRSGCFFGTEKEFMKAVEETHKGTKHEKTYKLAIEMAKIQFEGTR